MKKKTLSVLMGVIFIATFNTIFTPLAKSNNSKSANLLETALSSYYYGGEYHCYWWADEYWTGPIARDCYGCLEKPMKNPSMPSTCTFGIE